MVSCTLWRSALTILVRFISLKQKRKPVYPIELRILLTDCLFIQSADAISYVCLMPTHSVNYSHICFFFILSSILQSDCMKLTCHTACFSNSAVHHISRETGFYLWCYQNTRTVARWSFVVFIMGVYKWNNKRNRKKKNKAQRKGNKKERKWLKRHEREEM